MHKAGLWAGGILLVLMVLVGAGLMSLIGTRIVAPDWVRATVAEKINDDVSGLSLAFGELSVILERNWVPRLVMQNVVVSDGYGTPLMQLSDVQGTAALGPLLRGDMRPGSIQVSGVRVLVRRSVQGLIDLQLGDMGGGLEDAASLTTMINDVDVLLQRPQFAFLEEVRADNLSLRYEDARAGQAWSVDGAQFLVSRDAGFLSVGADFALLGNRDFATTVKLGFESEIGSTAADITFAFEDMPARDISGQSPALSWLKALEASMSGSLAMQVDEAGKLGPLRATLDIDAGVLHPNEAARPIAFDHASADLTYDPDSALIHFTDLQLQSKWITTQIRGKTRLEGMEDGWPDALISQFQAESFSANPMELYETPISFDGVMLDMRLRLDPFEVTLREMSITDQGRNLRITADVTAQNDGWVMSTVAHVPEITPKRLLELWPQGLEPKTRNWITRNVKSAELSNIQFVLEAAPGAKPDVYLGFDFDKMESQFIKNVPFIEGGRGTASIKDNQFVIVAHAGYVTAAQGGRIDITGSSFEIPDLRIKRGPGVVRLRTDSTITAALSLLNAGPFGFIDKAGQSVTVADGRAMMEGRLDFNVIDNMTPDDVTFTLSGILRDVRSDKLIKDRVLSASELKVDATSERLRLGGKGRIGQLPFDGDWTMPLVKGSNGRASVAGWVELSERFLEEFRIGLPPGSVSGSGRGLIEMDFERGTPPSFRLTSDLEGLGLALKPLNWSVTPETRGELFVAGRLGEPPEIEVLRLNAGRLQVQGSVTLEPDGQLQQANFSRVRLADWIDAPVDLVGRGAGNPPLVRVVGGSVDLRRTSLGAWGNGTQNRSMGGPISLRLDALQISDQIVLNDFNAQLDMSAGAQGDFTGKVNGQAAISGRVIPRNGRTAFVIQSEDAGGVLRSAKLLKQARDGTLQLVLVPGEGKGVYEGQLDASNLRIKDAPTMAALLNAISLVGILDQLGGEGIHFTDVTGKFQLAPDKVTLYSGSAVGASMGISMEGYYYPENKWLDIEGVISPIYALNAIGGVFARKGEGLVGFTYDLDGVATKPKVQVNPLSVLTPGLFREIFRRTPPGETGQGAQEKSEGVDTSPNLDR